MEVSSGCILSPSANNGSVVQQAWDITEGQPHEQSHSLTHTHPLSNAHTLSLTCKHAFSPSPIPLSFRPKVPTYVKGDAIVPVSLDPAPGDTIGRAAGPYQTLGFEIYPSAGARGTSRGMVYEDDGATTAYLDSEYVVTTVLVAEDGNGKVSITLEHPQGSYPWLPRTRKLGFS